MEVCVCVWTFKDDFVDVWRSLVAGWVIENVTSNRLPVTVLTVNSYDHQYFNVSITLKESPNSLVDAFCYQQCVSWTFQCK